MAANRNDVRVEQKAGNSASLEKVERKAPPVPESYLKSLNPKVSGHREAALRAVSEKAWDLQDLCLEFRSDRAIVLAAVRQNGLALSLIEGDHQQRRSSSSRFGRSYEEFEKLLSLPNLSADIEIVLEAMRENGRALSFAYCALSNSEELQAISEIQDKRARSKACDDSLAKAGVKVKAADEAAHEEIVYVPGPKIKPRKQHFPYWNSKASSFSQASSSSQEGGT